MGLRIRLARLLSGELPSNQARRAPIDALPFAPTERLDKALRVTFTDVPLRKLPTPDSACVRIASPDIVARQVRYAPTVRAFAHRWGEFSIRAVSNSAWQLSIADVRNVGLADLSLHTPTVQELGISLPKARGRTAPMRTRLLSSEDWQDRPEWIELAKRHNQVLGSLSAGNSFIGACETGENDFKELAASIRFLSDSNGTGRATSIIWDSFPGAAVLFLVQAGIYGYTHGEYWPKTRSLAGLPDANYQRRWGQSFLLFLRLFGLPSCEHEGSLSRPARGAYLRSILLHAMIPNDCLFGVFEHLLEPSVRSPRWAGLKPEELVSTWLKDPGLRQLIAQPVMDFLSHGGEVARTFVRDATEMVRRRYESQPPESWGQAALPPRVVEMYHRWLETGGSYQFQQRIRKPVLRLDPSSGVFLDLPDQVQPTERGIQTARWEVSLPGTPPTGVYAAGRKSTDGILYPRQEHEIPPEESYGVSFRLGGATLAEWTLVGLCSSTPWKVFSSRDLRELDATVPLRAEPTWFLLPTEAEITPYMLAEEDQGEMQRAVMGGEWYGYKSILLDLSKITAVQIAMAAKQTHVQVQGRPKAVVLDGGQVLQSADGSLDGIPTYGQLPPQLRLLSVRPLSDKELSEIALGIEARGPGGRICERRCPFQEVIYHSESNQVAFQVDVQSLFDEIPVAATVLLRMWDATGMVQQFQFRWIPTLSWSWSIVPRSLNLQLPEGAVARLLSGDAPEQQELLTGRAGALHLGEDEHFGDVELAWPRAKDPRYHVRLRIEGPRWAFITRRELARPVWQTRTIALLANEVLTTEAPEALFEARDFAWRQARVLASMQWPSDGAIQELQVQATGRAGRWRIPLGPAFDGLRRLADQEAQLYLTVDSSHMEEPAKIALMCLRPQCNLEPPKSPPHAPSPSSSVPSGPDTEDFMFEVLCCLSPACWQTIDRLAVDLGAPPDVIRRAIAMARQRYLIQMRNDACFFHPASFRKHQKALTEWWEKRYGS